MKPEEKDIWIFGSEKRNLICYTPESIRHPAKMSLHLCREIIKRYSKKGDLILDPMAGICTTLVEGMVLGRNVIGIEYEQKFCDMAEQNIKKVNKSMGFMNSLGKGMIIKGDSRELTSVLNQVPKQVIDSIITSPPFANSNEGGGLHKKRLEGKLTKDDVRMGNCAKQLSKDNIDNIKDYGKIDSIITSPPYEGIEGYQDKSFREKNPHLKRKNESIDYSDNKKDKKQLANLKGKNYLSEMFTIYKQCLKVLKEGGYMVLVLKNFVRAGKQIRLDLDTIKLVKAAGFIYITRHYRKINNPSFWITNAIQKWEKKNKGQHPYPLHEDIIVFKKEVKNGSKRRNLRKN